MYKDVTTEMKRQTRTQVSYLEQQMKDMESLLADMKTSIQAIPEFGASAVRGVSGRQIPEHMARVAAQMSKSTSALSILADMTDAANANIEEQS